MTELPVAFLGTFESLRMAPTFARGRRDERAGHVRSLTISSSLVVAQVRGPDDARAFRARIAVRAFGASEWAALEASLAREARFTAQLLDGRMPAGIGEVFEAAGLSLVPLSLDEVAMDCSCERWPMPCIHLAATCYALARSFQEDPFGAFAWRGRVRDELLSHLRELRSALAVTSLDPASRSSSARRPNTPGRRASTASTTSAGSRTADSPASDSPGAGSHDSDPHGVGRHASDAHGVGSPASDPRISDPDTADSHASGPHSPDSHPGVDHEDVGERLGEVSEFWGPETPAAVPAGGRPGAVSRPDALLDQLDPPPLAEGGRPIVDVLRPAYLALPDQQ